EFWSRSGFPIGLERNRVFISYANADAKWMEALTTHLEPIARHHPIEAWYDTKIRAGDNWKEEIRRALASTKVAVLLVSANFLKSSFIVEEELSYFINAARSGELKLLWVLLSPCAFAEDGLQDFQAAHDIKKPLSSLTQNEADASLVAVCQQIKEAMLVG
ncbi:MAG TPA: toll/interleukin-1 receptor domain-containing protein, partial [Thermoanaerobaculia bacterium]|nr:toll/interleukin-1 receptor domain-containing protein [Thermoanaerobaculia bacterium]